MSEIILKPQPGNQEIDCSIVSEDCDIELAKRHLLDFIIYTWYKKEPFIVGRHIEEICRKIDKILERYRNGESTYLIVTLPPRHSKSQIVSRGLPAFFKGRYPDSEVLITGYAENLLAKFSRDSRDKIVDRLKFQRMFPDLRLSYKTKSVTEWNFESRNGSVSYAGILGGLTGKGYDLGICDDPFKNREEAESETIRNKVWDEFTESFLTRAAPVSITMLLTTRWHPDDVIGRIENRMNPNSAEYEPDFPKFEKFNYPARSEKYKGGYLFLDRFSELYYKQKFATMSSYAAASIMQGSPIPRGGNLLKVNRVRVHENEKDFPKNVVWHRVWDLAHSKKERVKSDPDWTSGSLLALSYEKKEGVSRPHLWLKDVTRVRANAPVRDKQIKQTTTIDGDIVKVAIESNTDSKDTYENFVEILKGIRTVIKIVSTKDKVVRATPLEPIFEAGNVHILRGAWNLEWIKEVGQFPNGKHDDQVDNLSSGYNLLKSAGIITKSYTADAPSLKDEERKSLI